MAFNSLGLSQTFQSVTLSTIRALNFPLFVFKLSLQYTQINCLLNILKN